MKKSIICNNCHQKFNFSDLDEIRIKHYKYICNNCYQKQIKLINEFIRPKDSEKEKLRKIITLGLMLK